MCLLCVFVLCASLFVFGVFMPGVCFVCNVCAYICVCVCFLCAGYCLCVCVLLFVSMFSLCMFVYL